jgi:hypothetical protein
MSVFARDTKKREVQGFVLKIVNNQCPELKALIDGPRLDRRVNLTMVVILIPVEQKKLRVGYAFTAVTKEFSCTGLSVVLDGAKTLEEVVIGFQWDGETTYVRARAKHLNSMGGGFYQVGLKMTEGLARGDYPELQLLRF